MSIDEEPRTGHEECAREIEHLVATLDDERDTVIRLTAKLAEARQRLKVLDVFAQEWDYNDAGELVITFDTSAAEYVDEHTSEDADTTDVTMVWALLTAVIDEEA